MRRTATPVLLHLPHELSPDSNVRIEFPPVSGLSIPNQPSPQARMNGTDPFTNDPVHTLRHICHPGRVTNEGSNDESEMSGVIDLLVEPTADEHRIKVPDSFRINPNLNGAGTGDPRTHDADIGICHDPDPHTPDPRLLIRIRNLVQQLRQFTGHRSNGRRGRRRPSRWLLHPRHEPGHGTAPSPTGVQQASRSAR